VYFILIIIIGGALGGLASAITRTDGDQGLFLNIGVGVVGALVAGMIITPLLGDAPITAGDFDVSSLLVSFLGAVIVLTVLNLFGRGSVR
jgi:uncharacterized membrane protein YeaQ/YmgE (transglycosylase-associated protein family)